MCNIPYDLLHGTQSLRYIVKSSRSSLSTRNKEQTTNENQMYNFKFSSSHIEKVKKKTAEFNFNSIVYLIQ